MSRGHRLLWNERRPRAGLDGSSPRAGPLMPEPVRSGLPWWCFSDSSIQRRIKRRTKFCPCCTPSSRMMALNPDSSFPGWGKWINVSVTPLSHLENGAKESKALARVSGRWQTTVYKEEPETDHTVAAVIRKWQHILRLQPTWHRHQISHSTYPILGYCHPFQTAPSSFRLPRIKFMSP